VTLALFWQEYRGEHAQGYAYSWFCERYSDWRKRRIAPTMRQMHGCRFSCCVRPKHFAHVAHETSEIL
jgi:hypothetical protein